MTCSTGSTLQGKKPDYILEALHLRKTFGNFTAVDDISFHVLPGECFGLLGPNGAGKTSTIGMVYGFSPMTSGLLRVFNLDITRNWREIRSRIGVCHQDNNLDPELNVLQNLLVFARFFDIPRKEALQRAESLLDFMALGHRKLSPVLELSGGMMRRLILVRALINRPELIILDEPTTGLDPQSRHQIWARLEELKRNGLSILLTTHNMDEASMLCDRLVIMDHGKILVEGEPAELIRKHIGRDIIEVAEPDERLRRFVRERSLSHEDLGHRLIIYANGNEALYREIRDNYCRQGCIMRMAGLEDVFLRLTGRDMRE